MNRRDEDIQDVLDKIAQLAPSPANAPRPAALALRHLSQKMEHQPREPTFRRLSLTFRRRFAAATLLLGVAIGLAFTIPGVRAAASDFLGLFRVQKFAPISISPQQIALLEEIARTGLYPGEIVMVDEPGEPQEVNSVEEAESLVGWSVLTSSILGTPNQITVIDGGSGRLILNVENARALLRAAGADPGLIPDALDGAPVDVTIFPGVSQAWNDGIMLLQATSPLIEYPADVDAAAVGEALLQALGMDSSQARRLSREIDWTNTLLLPVPQNVASFSEVSVRGISGMALSSLDGRTAALLWERDGIVYVLSGASTAELIELADTLH